MMDMEKDLKSKTIDQLVELIEPFGGKKFQAKYIFSFVHGKGAIEINDITPLSKQLRQKLVDEGFYIGSISLVEKFQDPDGTVKYLFEMNDGGRIESVLLIDDDRKTLCISTQVGCEMRCLFCATGKLGFKRNLTASEIVEQVYKISAEVGRISNVVYMGMGEPMLNYDASVDSLRILNHPDGLNIGARHLTLSTCGIAERIEQFAGEGIEARLAVSLHAANDAARNKLMGCNKKWPIRDIFDAVQIYYLKTANRVTFEYIMIKGVNDSEDDADDLCELLKGVKCNVNLIEYNAHPGCRLKASDARTIKRFAGMLKKAGVETVIRYKRGRQINAACGQLGADWLKNSNSKS